jgi:hypothetical protein
MTKLRKILLSFLLSLIILVFITLIFISPLTKYLVEKYDEKYTGRQITMDHVSVNPFTGYFNFKNLKIHEFKSDTVFIYVKNAKIDFSLHKLFSKTLEISELSLDNFRGVIIQTKNKLNFSDLIEKFTNTDTVKPSKRVQHINILNVKINNGELHFKETITPINYFIKNIYIESSGKKWDIDTMTAKYSFISGIGTGEISGYITTNVKTLDYRLATVVHNFDLNIIGQYLKDLTNYGTFSAILDADMKSKGNFTDQGKVTTSGNLSISNFHFGKNPKEDYFSIKKLSLAIKKISPRNYIYMYDSISIDQPYLKYEKYDHLDNLQTIFGKKGSNISNANSDSAKFNLVIEIGNYIKHMSKNLFKSNYKINRLAIYNCNLKYNDYSTREKFSISLNPLFLSADSIDKTHNRVNCSLNASIKPYGTTNIQFSINPKDEKDFNLKYSFKNLPVTLFNPYIIPLTSFSIDRGIIELDGNWNVINGYINSTNHIVIIDPRVYKREKNKNIKWIPLRLVMFIIRERGNVIDYDIPITGNLNKPNFNLHDVFLDALGNIFIKPPTTPYRIKVKNIESEIEESLTVKWALNENSVQESEKKNIRRIVNYLVKNPKASILVTPNIYEAKEKEFILFFEAKKKYFIACNNNKNNFLSKEELVEIENMSVKDSSFIYYLNKHENGFNLFTVQEKCNNLIGADIVNKIHNKLTQERLAAFIYYFRERNVFDQIKIAHEKNNIPFNGLSFYKIEYRGGMPDYLIEANQQMSELNNEEPRKKFKKDRKKNKNL